MSTHKHIVIIGAGTGGISVASRLTKHKFKVSIIDPNTKHYYQPLFTLIGGGDSSMEKACKDMSSVIPKGIDHIKKRVHKIEASKNLLILDDDSKLEYDYLIASPGIQIDWNKIENLEKYLEEEKVHTNYSEKYVRNTYKAFKKFNISVTNAP